MTDFTSEPCALPETGNRSQFGMVHLVSAAGAAALLSAALQGHLTTGLHIPTSEVCTIVRQYQSLGFAIVIGQVNFVGYIVPLWFLLVCIAFLPGRALLRHLARWRVSMRATAGQCTVCGYDLRATPDRCPECGNSVSVK